jgi:hypothetical protein
MFPLSNRSRYWPWESILRKECWRQFKTKKLMLAYLWKERKVVNVIASDL